MKEIVKIMITQAKAAAIQLLTPFRSFFERVKHLKDEKKYWSILFLFLLTCVSITGVVFLLYKLLLLIGSIFHFIYIYSADIIAFVFMLFILIMLIRSSLEDKRATAPSAPAVEDITAAEEAKKRAVQIHPYLRNALHTVLSFLAPTLPVISNFSTNDLACQPPYSITDGITLHHFVLAKKDPRTLLPEEDLNAIKRQVQSVLSNKIMSGDIYGIPSGILLDQNGFVKDTVVVDRVCDTGVYLMFSVTINDAVYEKRSAFYKQAALSSANTDNTPYGNF